MIVNFQKPIEFINDSNCIVDLSELEKAIIWYSNKHVSRLKKIFLFGLYPGVAIHKEKIHVHRLLMMYWLQQKLEMSQHVHHIDGNKLNAIKENLKVLKASEHMSITHTGRTISESHRQRIAQANRNRTGKIKFPKRRNIPMNELAQMVSNGDSLNRIAKHFGVDWTTIRSRIRENPELI